MRKILLGTLAAAVLSTAASAQRWDPNYVAPAAGVVAGTVVGIGAHQGWFGTGEVLGTTWPGGTIAGAATTGFVVGVGTAVAVHALTTPCQGAHMFFGNLFTSAEGCVNGRPAARPVREVRVRR